MLGRKLKPITVDEMERAEVMILKLVQNDAFSEEITALREVEMENHKSVRMTKRSKKINIKKISSLLKLDPFIDNNGLLRVGGRLSKSEDLAEDLKGELQQKTKI